MKSSLGLLCGAHLLGNALVLWLGYLWLSVAESDTAHLFGSALLILLLVCLAAWLHATALIFFRRQAVPPFSLRDCAKVALQHLPAILLLFLLALLLYWGLNVTNAHLENPAFQLASWLTLTLRKPVAPSSVLAVFHGITWLLRWFLLPALIAPVAAAVSIGGFQQFRFAIVKPQLWRSLKIFAALLGALWLPARLLHWIPAMPSFSAEMASFLLRGSIAYLLFAGCLLLLERITASGTPNFTQRSNSLVL